MGLLLPLDGALGALLSHAAIKVVDAGARGKVRGELAALAPVAELVAFEPEADEALRLTGAEAGVWLRQTVVPEALGEREGVATLHVTAKPAMSSLREPDAAVAADFAKATQLDVVERHNVRVTTLDAAAERYGFRDACFLKLDTPGFELEVLRGGERLLAGAVVAIFVESHLQPLYRGAALFSEVDAYLRGRGFELFDLTRSLWRGPPLKADRFSRRRVVAADCLYLRSPRVVVERGDEVELARLLAIALGARHFDLAQRLVESEPSAAILSRRAGEGLARDVDEYVARATRRVLRGLSERDASLALHKVAKDSRSA